MTGTLGRRCEIDSDAGETQELDVTRTDGWETHVQVTHPPVGIPGARIVFVEGSPADAYVKMPPPMSQRDGANVDRCLVPCTVRGYSENKLSEHCGDNKHRLVKM